jgi:hypothetical protein
MSTGNYIFCKTSKEETEERKDTGSRHLAVGLEKGLKERKLLQTYTKPNEEHS